MSLVLRVLPALALFAAASGSGLAQAACPAVPAPTTIGAGAELVSLEGPLSAIDPVDRTVTVIGTCVTIPVGLLIDTDADGVGDITFDELVAPGLITPIGGSMIIDATATVDLAGNTTFIATNPYFEFGEHVVVGPLMSVDATAGTFVVAGTTVTMNTDPRIPAELWDLGGNTIAIEDMVGFEGTVVSAEGYFRNNQVNARMVETEVVQVTEGSDTVVIERAQYRISKRQIEVRGQVTAHSVTGAFTTTVSVDVNCDGTAESPTQAVVVDPVLGLGEFRFISGNNAFTTTPTVACVTSPLGGTAQRAVDAR